MRLAVLPNNLPLPPGFFDGRIALFQPPGPGTVGTVGTQVVEQFRRSLGRSAAVHAWDLTGLAMAVIAADRHVNRRAVSADGWTRRIEIAAAVSDPDLWNGLRRRVEAMLDFLTGDVWSVSFVPGGFVPAVVAQHRVPARPETCISLLSGGLDSLIGAIDLRAAGEQPVFVSNRVRGDCEKQRAFADAVGGGTILSLNHNARSMTPSPEISQRPRSLAFLAFGILAATALDRYQQGCEISLNVPENGFISLNVPLTRFRSGSLSTRTTHPIFMAHMQELILALGLRVSLVNAYRLKTKGEMMVECADQAVLERLAPLSMSCGRGGRINRHCGQCLPCLVRRSAFFRHNGDVALDGTRPAYSRPQPGTSFAAPAFSRYDDVGRQGRQHALPHGGSDGPRRDRASRRDRHAGPALVLGDRLGRRAGYSARLLVQRRAGDAGVAQGHQPGGIDAGGPRPH